MVFMSKLRFLVLASLFFSALSFARAPVSAPISTLDPVLKTLLQFHPTWITRSVTSHDGTGGNDDGNWNGNPPETLDGVEYQTLFHGMGEGRILRLWMTDSKEEMITDYRELRIEIDGKTFYRGKPLDFFNGNGPWKYPLVMNYEQTSGGLLSYVPIPYLQEAKILLAGNPHYFQVTYRQGQGSSEGPSASDVSRFMGDRYWVSQNTELPPIRAKVQEVVASGPVTVSEIHIDCLASDLSSLQIRVGNHPAVPASFFFGLGSTGSALKGAEWAEVHSEINDVSLAGPRVHLVTRLPVPLQAGETLSLENTSGRAGDVFYSIQTDPVLFPGVHLDPQFYDQWTPGISTTMRFYESQKATQFVSLVEQITDNPPGDRSYLEGDEMIRTDQMTYPLQLGTGTEDYFNGGWYFAMGPFTNPNSGEPRFNVIHPENDWKSALFETSLYRHHVLDPVVGRTGIRFGFEAGPTGSFTTARYKTLATAYQFDFPAQLEDSRIGKGGEDAQAATVVSRFDAEFNQTDVTENVYSISNAPTHLRTECPDGASGVLLTRTYDAGTSTVQAAIVSVNDRDEGLLFESYSNPSRRFAQDAIWLDLVSGDCDDGLDIALSPLDDVDQGWNAVDYQIQFFGSN
jgi:hypothetical protein